MLSRNVHCATAKWCSIHLFIAGLLSFWVGAAAGQEVWRTWTDSSGRYRVTAKFVREEGGKVTLQKQGGGEIQLELSKLSAIDQRVIADLEARKVTAPQASAAKPAAPSKIDWSKVPSISAPAGAGEWKITPPASSGAMFTTPPKAITTIPRFDFFDAFTSLVVNTAAKKAAVGRMQKGPGSNKAISRAVLWDLQSGKAISPTGLPGEMLPLALADDGQQVLMRRNEFFFKDRLEVWVPQGGKFAKTLEWTPYDDAKDAARNVRWAEFIDASTLATANNTGKVVLWSFPDVKPLCTFETGNNCVPALSPDRKLLAWSNGKQLGLLDVARRQMIAVQPTPRDLHSPALAFCPSGKRLACGAFDSVLVWDVATGKLEQDTLARGLPINDQTEFAQDDFLLLGAWRTLVLLEWPHQVRLWSYTGVERVCSRGGWTFMAVANQDKSDALLALQLPQAEATRALQQAVQRTDPSIFGRGTSVRIEVTGVEKADDQEKIRQSLVARLAEMGCTPSDKGTFTLAAAVETNDRSQGNSKSKEMRSSLRLVSGTKTLWEQKSGTYKSESWATETGYRWSDSGTKPLDFFAKAKLPSSLLQPSDNKNGPPLGTLGQSQVTVDGLR